MTMTQDAAAERQGLGAMGLVGLGVMGRNLALNMADRGARVTAFDPWEPVRSAAAGILGAQGAVVDDLPALAAALPTPRRVLIMVKAGAPVDGVIDGLAPVLDPGDILIDGGNSHYQDTLRRQAALAGRGLGFLGLGISGGEEGARHGPSLMAGGTQADYDRVAPVLTAIAARFDGRPCCARVGDGGAGHFVKMVHNGIEYAMMQAIAEAYDLMRGVLGLAPVQMADRFAHWNDGPLAGYLIGITADILATADPDAATTALVDRILDSAGQKGTGRWTSEAALALGVPTPTLTEAVFARALAALKAERVAAAAVLPGPDGSGTGPEQAGAQSDLGDALLGGFVAIYAQGLALIAAAGQEQGWAADLSSVAAIWRAGCIIRARLLDDIARAFAEAPDLANLVSAPFAREMLRGAAPGWRRTVGLAQRAGVPAPALASALAYVDGYRQARGPAALIQAQRDYFGAHTYRRLDRAGDFHTDWTTAPRLPRGTET